MPFASTEPSDIQNDYSAPFMPLPHVARTCGWDIVLYEFNMFNVYLDSSSDIAVLRYSVCFIRPWDDEVRLLNETTQF